MMLSKTLIAFFEHKNSILTLTKKKTRIILERLKMQISSYDSSCSKFLSLHLNSKNTLQDELTTLKISSTPSLLSLYAVSSPRDIARPSLAILLIIHIIYIYIHIHTLHKSKGQDGLIEVLTFLACQGGLFPSLRTIGWPAAAPPLKSQLGLIIYFAFSFIC